MGNTKSLCFKEEEAYTDSDYARASLDRKSTTGGCQFLWCRLISWQCKKQTVVANSITEAEYVAASSCCGQVEGLSVVTTGSVKIVNTAYVKLSGYVDCKSKKFIQRTGRNMDFKEKRPVSLDKSKFECYNCHKKGHFAREYRSGRNQGRRSYGDNGRSNAPITESSSQALVAQDGLDEYAIRNKIIESQKTELNTKTSETTGPSISTARPVCTARPNISTARLSISTARPVYTARPSISTARPFISTARPSISTARPVYTSRPIYPRMDNIRPRALYSPIKRSYYTRPAVRPKDLKQDVKTFKVKNMTTTGTRAVVNTSKGKMNNVLKKSRWVWWLKGNYMDHESKEKGSFILKKFEYVDPKGISKSVDHAVVDSGCSSHMTGNKAYLLDYEDYNGGFVAFGSDPKGGKITGKGKIRTANLDFDDVYFVDELKFNLFSVSQICDKKNSVLFTDTECLILSPSFKLLDENQVVLRAPRQNDVYSLDLKNIVPS
ncbi:ribonuclease H-like domain-containing protein [Tanacetum coccineum]